MTEMPEDPGRLLREGLRCLHLSGAIFLRAEFSSPWAHESPDSADIVRMLSAGDRRVILFHIFTIVILPFCDRHRVGNPDLARPTAMSELMPPPPWSQFPIIRFGGGGPATTMICGYLISDDVPFNPVLASLPRLMRLRLADGPLMQRLPELLFMECLSEYARTRPEAEGGWLAALVDPVVGRALACLHRQPDQPWTLKELARRAASSRSVLDQRFLALLGRAPMAYLTAWRLQLASRQLRTTSATLAEIVGATGYGSEASLSRAFKRQVGMSPGQWRVVG